jgi:hypothetical protein
MGKAVGGNLSELVVKVEEMILQYYDDVHTQAEGSFGSAKTAAWIGFGVLIGTVLYIVVNDLLGHLSPSWRDMDTHAMSVGSIGLISGALIEFIAWVNFSLYGRAAKQFSAFHICLERTHRYLIAYKIAEEVETKKDDTLQRLVCIMANAPMITRQDIEDVGQPILGSSVGRLADEALGPVKGITAP